MEEQQKHSEEAYSTHFLNLRADGGWKMQMSGASSHSRTLASPSSFARSNLLFLESIVLYHNTPAGFFIQRAEYNSYQFVYTIQGRGVLEYEGRSYQLDSGDCFLIDCQKPHTYYTDGSHDWLHHGVQFNGHQMPALFRYIVSSDAIVTNFPDIQRMNKLHEHLAEAALSKLASSDIIINRYLTDFLSNILLKNQLTSETQLSPKISEVCAYIDASFTKKQSLDEIAANCYISKYYLCREFKRQMGKTIGSYLNECRILAAKKRLVETRDSVSGIARYCGFDSINYFFYIFKKSEGITPLQYRHQLWNPNDEKL